MPTHTWLPRGLPELILSGTRGQPWSTQRPKRNSEAEDQKGLFRGPRSQRQRERQTDVSSLAAQPERPVLTPRGQGVPQAHRAAASSPLAPLLTTSPGQTARTQTPNHREDGAPRRPAQQRAGNNPQLSPTSWKTGRQTKDSRRNLGYQAGTRLHMPQRRNLACRVASRWDSAGCPWWLE